MHTRFPFLRGRVARSAGGRTYRGRTALAWLLVLLGLLTVTACRAASPRVVVIELHGPVWPSTATFVAEQINAAWQSGADGLILDLDTTHGSASAAAQIKTRRPRASLPLPVGIAAYVHDQALGPGSLIAVACKTLAMAPGGALGGAAAGQSKADFRGAAEATGRNPDIAAAFVSADAPLPSLGVKPTDSLTLTDQAGAERRLLRCGRVGLPGRAGEDGPRRRRRSCRCIWTPGRPSRSGSASRGRPSCCSRWASPWSLIELLTWHSWGLAGVIGGALVLLIFAAHITVGTATWVGVVLFLAGIALLLFETHVFPGHGLSALGGLVLIFLGMFYALGGVQTGALYSAAAALRDHGYR